MSAIFRNLALYSPASSTSSVHLPRVDGTMETSLSARCSELQCASLHKLLSGNEMQTMYAQWRLLAGATEHTLFASHCQREVCAARRIAARNTGHLETSPSYRRPAVGEPTKSRKLDYIRLSSGKSRSYRFGSSVIKRSECAKACDPMMKSASKRFGPDARTVVAVSHDVQNVGQPQAIPTVET